MSEIAIDFRDKITTRSNESFKRDCPTVTEEISGDLVFEVAGDIRGLRLADRNYLAR